MEKQHSVSAVSENEPVASSYNVVQPNTKPDQAPLPHSQAKPWRPQLWMLIVCVAIVVGALAVLQVICLLGPGVGDENLLDNSPDVHDRSNAPGADDERVCTLFTQLKNAADPAAIDLLGPAPTVPSGPISRAEADHLQAEFFLREEVRIVGVGRDGRSRALVLFTKGNVFAPTLQVKTPDGVETAQRTMSNPDLIVEVRDGRVYGIAANLHQGP